MSACCSRLFLSPAMTREEHLRSLLINICSLFCLIIRLLRCSFPQQRTTKIFIFLQTLLGSWLIRPLTRDCGFLVSLTKTVKTDFPSNRLVSRSSSARHCPRVSVTFTFVQAHHKPSQRLRALAFACQRALGRHRGTPALTDYRRKMSKICSIFSRARELTWLASTRRRFRRNTTRIWCLSQVSRQRISSFERFCIVFLYSTEDPRLCYSIREQICVGVWPNPKGFESRNFAQNLYVKSRCIDASEFFLISSSYHPDNLSIYSLQVW